MKAKLAIIVILLKAILTDTFYTNLFAFEVFERTQNSITISREDLSKFFLSGSIVNDPNGLPSLLSLIPGLTFRNTGDIGAETWFIVRNYGRDNSRMTLVLLDGRPLNLSSNHTIEFDDIPLDIIENIKIYQGPTPSKFGGFQSVVEINTIKNKDIFDVDVSFGSDATYRFNTTFGKSGKFHYIANINYNFSLAQSDKKLSGFLENFQYSNREFRAILPTFKIGYQINKDLDITLQGNFVDFKKMFSTYPIHNSEASRERLMHNYSLVFKPTNASNLDYELIIYQNREQETLNPVFPEDTTYNVHWGKQKRSLTGLRANYKFDIIEGKISLQAGVEAHRSKGKTDDDYLYFKYTKEQNFMASFINSYYSLWSGSNIILGARVDKQNDIDKLYFSPYISISQNFINDKLMLYLNYGHQRRWIPLNEVNTFNRPTRILGPQFLIGNVSLPEKTLNMELFKSYEIGFKSKFFDDKLITNINYFYQVNEGQYGAPVFEIRPVISGGNVPPTFKAAIVSYDRNFPGYDISSGLEFSVQSKIFKNLTVYANATYFIEAKTKKYDNVSIYDGPLGNPNAQNAINNSIGRFILPYNDKSIIPGAYNFLANLMIFYNPDELTNLNSTIRYRGETSDPIMKFGKDPKVEEIPAAIIFDISGQRQIYNSSLFRISLTFAVNNLFDKKYETFVHYPMQGRFITFGLKTNI